MHFLLMLKNSNMAIPFVPMVQGVVAARNPVHLTMHRITIFHMTRKVIMVGPLIHFEKGTNQHFACDAVPWVTGPAIARPQFLIDQTN